MTRICEHSANLRLTPAQVDIIRASAAKNFGRTAQVWLFGSRVDVNRRGGDIDLYVEPEPQDPAELLDAKLHFLMELHKKLGEQKIDVVVRRSTSSEILPIYQLARETGVRLL